MSDLRLSGLSDSGDHLILIGPEGQRFRLALTDELRAAVRRDGAHLNRLRAASSASPREIQGLIRAGACAAEVSQSLGVDVEYVRRFETAVLAERAHIATLAAAAQISREVDAPTLEELVVNRLAARGVDTAQITWDAAKTGDRTWTITASYHQQDQLEHATWSFDPGTRHVNATNAGAIALTETATRDEPIRRHLNPVPSAGTEHLLDELASRRGRRLGIDTGAEETPAPPAGEPFPATSLAAGPARLPDTPASADSLPASPEPAPTHLEAGADPTLELGIEPDSPAPAAPARKRTRSAMPSWDEIVFGGKSD